MMGKPTFRHEFFGGSGGRRNATVALIILAAVVLIALLSKKKPAAATESHREPEERASEVQSVVPTPAPAPVASGSSDDRAPIIDEIKVEKPEVCEGEDNLVTVRAHTENGTDAYLHYLIDGKLGPSVPVR